MPKIPSRFHQIFLGRALAPFTLGAALLTIAVLPVKALSQEVQGSVYIHVGQPQLVYPNTIYESPPTTIIYSSPYPSPYIYNNSPNTSSLIYGSPIPRPVPVPEQYNSVLVNPVIVNPPGYPINYVGHSQVIYANPGYSYGYPAYGYPGRSRIFIRH